MNKGALFRVVDFHRLESFFFLAAMLLAIVLEAACVYWLAPPATLAFRSGEPHALIVQWTRGTLPEYWLAGALAVLVYRVALMLHPPRAWELTEVQRNRSAFLRLWQWTVALGCVQMAALYLDWISFGVR